MRGSITKIAKGLYRVRVDLGKDTIGKRQMHSESVRGTKAEADTVLNAVLERLGQGTFVQNKSVSFAEYLRKWIALRDGTIAASTVERWRDMIEKKLVPHLGHHRLQKLQPMHLNTFYKTMRETGGRRGGGLAPATVLLFHRVIFMCLGHAERNGYVGFNVTEQADPPKLAKRRRVPFFKTHEVVAIMHAAEGEVWFAPLMVSAACGLRRGEVLGLRWSDLDLDKGKLSVSQTVQLIGGKITIKATPKTEDSERAVDVPAIAVDVLRRQRAEQAERRLALGLGRDPDGLVFTDLTEGPLHPKSMSDAFKRLRAEVGAPAYPLKNLRHSHATMLLLAKIPVSVVSQRLGHSRVSTTLDYYAGNMEGMQDEAAAVTEDVFGTAMRTAQARNKNET